MARMHACMCTYLYSSKHCTISGTGSSPNSCRSAEITCGHGDSRCTLSYVSNGTILASVGAKNEQHAMALGVYLLGVRPVSTISPTGYLEQSVAPISGRGGFADSLQQTCGGKAFGYVCVVCTEAYHQRPT